MKKQTTSLFSWETIAFIVFCALMGLILARSLNNGTRRTYVFEDLPAVVDLNLTPADGTEPRALQLSFGDKDILTVVHLNATYGGRFTMTNTNRESARYTMNGKAEDETTCYVGIQTPLAPSSGHVTGPWMITLYENERGRQVLAFLDLAEDGTAHLLLGEPDVFDIPVEDLRTQATPGTWTKEEAEGTTHITVNLQDGSTLTMALQGR